MRTKQEILAKEDELMKAINHYNHAASAAIHEGNFDAANRAEKLCQELTVTVTALEWVLEEYDEL